MRLTISARLPVFSAPVAGERIGHAETEAEAVQALRRAGITAEGAVVSKVTAQRRRGSVDWLRAWVPASSSAALQKGGGATSAED